jgi:hypothetical protein
MRASVFGSVCLAVAILAILSVVDGQGILFGSYTQAGENPSLWSAMNSWFQETNSTTPSNLQQSVRVLEIGWAAPSQIQSQINMVLDAWTWSYAVPIITWMPYPYKTWTSPTPNDDIASGQYDDYIDAFLGNLSTQFVYEPTNYRRMAYIRFAPSPNGNWFPWSPECPPCGSTGQKIKQTASSYVSMWNYVVKKIRSPKYKLGSDVIQIIFDVSAVDLSDKFEKFAPSTSDPTVAPHWFSITGINWGNTLPGNQWMSVKNLFYGPLQRLKAINNTLPMALVSVGSVSEPNGIEAKEEWIEDLCLFTKQNLRMVSYHNADTNVDVAVFGGMKGIPQLLHPIQLYELHRVPRVA